MVLGAAGLLEGAEIAATRESCEWLTAALPNTTVLESDAIVVTANGKLMTAACSTHGVELGLAAVERFLGAKLTATLRGSWVIPPGAHHGAERDRSRCRPAKALRHPLPE